MTFSDWVLVLSLFGFLLFLIVVLEQIKGELTGIRNLLDRMDYTLSGQTSSPLSRIADSLEAQASSTTDDGQEK